MMEKFRSEVPSFVLDNPIRYMQSYAHASCVKLEIQTNRKDKRVVIYFDGDLLVDKREMQKGIKKIKREAAIEALQILYGKAVSNITFASGRQAVVTHEVVDQVVQRSRFFMSVCTQSQFIMDNIRKIHASFVLDFGSSLEVVAIGTGNRCIQRACLTEAQGKKVIDSHAEIVARRAFIRYLYNQLLKINDQSSSIFELSRNGKYKLRNSIKVYLYISRTPCGGAALAHQITPKQKANGRHGKLRTLLADGQGVIPTETNVDSTQGQPRLRVMTCSDKICRWNILGVQGSLLSHFIDPVYIDSVIIGSTTGQQRELIPQAINGRLEGLTLAAAAAATVQHAYRVNSAEIRYPSARYTGKYRQKKTKKFSLVWSADDDGFPEVVDGTTGVIDMGSSNPPRAPKICKRELYSLFQKARRIFKKQDAPGSTYRSDKDNATAYQNMKQLVDRHFKEKGYGPWHSVQKRFGVDNFH